MKKNIAVFGSTGSIGRQTLSVADHHREAFCVKAIIANSNIDLVRRQIESFEPEYVGMYSKAAATELQRLYPGSNIVGGEDVNLLAELSEIDIVVNGVSGFAGLSPLLHALDAGKTIALANKESIVCGHTVINEAIKKHGGTILPVDSEQSAIFQCLASGRRQDVKSLILTASGGMFREFTKEQLASVTPEMALHHPTWSMGGKITVDSSSLFNKGLELMEAGWLFDMGPDNIRIIIHPQSIIHSMVEFSDGAVFAQMSPPDMRLAIQYALTYPERIPSQLPELDFAKLGSISFFEPDAELFPAIPLAYEAFRDGESLPIAYNSANEIAVKHFIAGKLKFTEISECVAYAMAKISRIGKVDTVEKIYELDSEARLIAENYCRQHTIG